MFEFIYHPQNYYDRSIKAVEKVEFRLVADSNLTEMCQGFEDFLRACSYSKDVKISWSYEDEDEVA